MLILGIESSCDETAAALVDIKVINGIEKIKIISNVVSSQIKIHQKYGGVVPEVAARAHLENILPVITEALKGKKKIDLIAVTIGPGLITSLLVGIETAKTLAYLWNKPIIGINHLEGHIYANFINCELQPANYKLFPMLCLVVSGGHTELVLMKDHLKYKKIGQTKDDAAGEAFDKAARLLNLGYPGGPAISQQAENFIISKKRQPTNYKIVSLPRPMINSNDYNFSFSGLKTALFYQLKKDRNWREKIPEYCYEFQQAIIDVLISKTFKAVGKYKVKTIILSGGVAANQELREQFKFKIQNFNQRFLLTPQATKFKINFFVPSKKLCTDNAVMIAVAGYFNAIKKKCASYQKIKSNLNFEL